jgi:hypothetical protein
MTSDVFLTALRVTDNQEELIATRDMISREIAQLVRPLVYKTEFENSWDIKALPFNVFNQYRLDIIALLNAEDAVLSNTTISSYQVS